MRTLTNFLVFTFILSTSFVRAQTSETCNQNLSIFAESAKVKNYDAAYEPWTAVRAECPSLNRAIYTYGERILKSRLKKACTRKGHPSKGNRGISKEHQLIRLRIPKQW